MAIYKIPISWESYQVFEKEASSLEEAIFLSLKEFLSIPDNNYLDDSFNIDIDILEENYKEEIKDIDLNKIYNKL